MVQKTVLAAPEETLVVKTFNDAMARVYLWMAAGLGLTAVVAMLVAQNEGLAQAVSGKWYVYTGLLVAQILLVMGISGGIDKLAPGIALGLFFLFSALMGVTLSMVFLVHDLGTIGVAFGGAAATFTAMSLVGLTTKKDLTGLGPLLLASLLGLIVAGVANSFLGSGVLGWVVSFAGVVVFMGLMAHDAQAIKTMTSEVLAEGDEHAVARVGVLGALSLYLDLINLALFILSLLGDDD